MSGTGQELEVKFYLRQPERLQARLEELGARLEQPPTHEINLRFDTPERSLLNSGRLLRLRQDSAARITFKGPGRVEGGARLRQELEFIASDFATARAVIEALGFEVNMMYEKKRATYALVNVLVTLDEMPYGSFAEIEGPDGASIQQAAAQLGLDWGQRILESYTVLFEQARHVMGFTFRDLSFENFTGLDVSPQTLGVQPAD
ncbi:MAG TPA: class IV adenylate cyclase [Anaerolineales bacterium]|nr:class IV adenylate cyclase [Anaerolineales bacterium]